jgi:Ca-activated chloride channel family protein
MNASVRFVLLTLAVLPLTAATAARRQQEPAPTFQASSDLVVIPVTVTDKHGRLITGLTQDRFAVYDNDRPTDIAFFSGEDTPVTVALVVDNSASMLARHGEVIAGAAAFARLSNPDDQMLAILFNENVEDALGGRTLSAADEGDLAAALEAAHPDGQTALYDGLMAALDRLSAVGTTRKVVILISDGGDNASQATLDIVLDRAKRSNVTIYTVGLVDPTSPDVDTGVLKKLATVTGGERFLPASGGPLLQACQEIAHEIRESYTLAIEPRGADGAFHRLRAVVTGPDARALKVRTRPGYVAGGKAKP